MRGAFDAKLARLLLMIVGARVLSLSSITDVGEIWRNKRPVATRRGERWDGMVVNQSMPQ